MRLSTRGRFAITAMIDLALRQTTTPVPLQDLAQRHRISMSYLEQMFAKLRQHGLVESTRGPGGGYTLARTAHSISVADIIGAIEDGADPRSEAGQRETSASAQAMTQDLWDALQTTVVAYLKTERCKPWQPSKKPKASRCKSVVRCKRVCLLSPSKRKTAPPRPTRCLHWRTPGRAKASGSPLRSLFGIRQGWYPPSA